MGEREITVPVPVAVDRTADGIVLVYDDTRENQEMARRVAVAIFNDAVTPDARAEEVGNG